ncbi:kinase-like domain-containing protein [Mycena sp. CBHHK59/15]|nr:kinase-like domain-containing protein [Mycena sp. CBHHK59/15]
MHLIVQLPIAQDLAACVFSLTLERSNSPWWWLEKFGGIVERWAKSDILTSLANYHAVVEILLNFLQDSTPDWRISHATSQEIFMHLSCGIPSIVAQMALILREPETYKTFLDCRGTLAQQLLDLVQDLLDYDSSSTVRPLLFKALIRLSRASGLHPRCFALSGLETSGHQVAAGGSGDIWKGLVRGQSVSVKVMRIFQKADVEAALKEFGREALIWRQLSHPNLLPFFGLYYLNARLCLVSPWMVNGNILEFLRKDLVSYADRVSLISDVANGLEYLHDKHVVHGDLKAINILVTPSRRAVSQILACPRSLMR